MIPCAQMISIACIPACVLSTQLCYRGNVNFTKYVTVIPNNGPLLYVLRDYTTGALGIVYKTYMHTAKQGWEWRRGGGGGRTHGRIYEFYVDSETVKSRGGGGKFFCGVCCTVDALNHGTVQ